VAFPVVLAVAVGIGGASLHPGSGAPAQGRLVGSSAGGGAPGAPSGPVGAGGAWRDTAGRGGGLDRPIRASRPKVKRTIGPVRLISVKPASKVLAWGNGSKVLAKANFTHREIV